MGQTRTLNVSHDLTPAKNHFSAKAPYPHAPRDVGVPSACLNEAVRRRLKQPLLLNTAENMHGRDMCIIGRIIRAHGGTLLSTFELFTHGQAWGYQVTLVQT